MSGRKICRWSLLLAAMACSFPPSAISLAACSLICTFGLRRRRPCPRNEIIPSPVLRAARRFRRPTRRLSIRRKLPAFAISTRRLRHLRHTCPRRFTAARAGRFGRGARESGAAAHVWPSPERVQWLCARLAIRRAGSLQNRLAASIPPAQQDSLLAHAADCRTRPTAGGASLQRDGRHTARSTAHACSTGFGPVGLWARWNRFPRSCVGPAVACHYTRSTCRSPLFMATVVHPASSAMRAPARNLQPGHMSRRFNTSIILVRRRQRAYRLSLPCHHAQLAPQYSSSHRPIIGGRFGRQSTSPHFVPLTLSLSSLRGKTLQ